MPYLTVNIANGGTWYDNGTDPGHASSFGHMWYSLSSDNGDVNSFGFGPVNGKPLDDGDRLYDDDTSYQSRYYSVTVEITQEQYNRMLAFGTNPESGNFRWGTSESANFDPNTYRGLINSCIDFTWKALEVGGFNPDGFEGAVLPSLNADWVQYALDGYRVGPTAPGYGPTPNEAKERYQRPNESLSSQVSHMGWSDINGTTTDVYTRMDTNGNEIGSTTVVTSVDGESITITNKTNNVVTSKTEYSVNDDGSWSSNKYDGNGNKIEDDHVNADGSYKNNVYGANGETLNSTTVNKDGSYTSSYYKDGKLSQQQGIDCNDVEFERKYTDGVMTQETTTFVNPVDGSSITDAKNFNTDGSLKDETITTQDKDGNTTSESVTTINPDDGSRTTDTKTYNPDGSLKNESIITKDKDGAITSEILKIPDSDGNMHIFTRGRNGEWKDENGNILSERMQGLFSGINTLIQKEIVIDFDGLISAIRPSFKTAEVTRSPLVLDLNGDGVNTTSIMSGTFFDFCANGFAEQTGWADSGDGLLALDRNGNGVIDDGTELFGNNTILTDGTKAANGFAALAELDENGDGKIDANDAAYAQLKVWKGDQLLSLADAGVASINTGYSSQNVTDANGNQHLQTGTFTRTDGTTAAVDDVWFKVDPANTIDQTNVEISADIAALPDLQGFGNVHSLHVAMELDTSGRLKSLVEQFSAETDPTARKEIMLHLMYAWAGVENVDPYSRAATRYYGNAIGDARKLETLEEFLGEEYLGTWCWGERDPNPHGKAAPILLKAFDELTNHMTQQLMAQTHLKSLFDGISLSWDDSAQTFALDVSAPIAALRTAYEADAGNGMLLMSQFSQSLAVFGDFGEQVTGSLRQQGEGGTDDFSFQLSTIGMTSVIGDGAHNTLSASGSADSALLGLGGNDRLYGAAGNDSIQDSQGANRILLEGLNPSEAMAFGWAFGHL